MRVRIYDWRGRVPRVIGKNQAVLGRSLLIVLSHSVSMAVFFGV
jgi:hypothetical protein